MAGRVAEGRRAAALACGGGPGCADLALRALTDDLNADLTRAVVRKKIGPLETEYDRNSPQSKRFRPVDMALAPFLKGSSASARLVRA